MLKTGARTHQIPLYFSTKGPETILLFFRFCQGCGGLAVCSLSVFPETDFSAIIYSMPDIQYTPIILDPNTNAVSGPMADLPPVLQSVPPPSVQPVTTPTTANQTQSAVPLQPVQRVSVAATVAQVAAPVQAAGPARQAELHQQLETITQEESKLLGTIKDWVAWIQGAETKKQAIEREMATIDKQFQSTGGSIPTSADAASTGPDRAVLEKQMRAAEAQLKAIQDQQKIEEKKAFDNYSAGGINREGLLKEMERINIFYATPLDNIKTKISNFQLQLNPAQPAAAPATQPTPTTATAPAQKILEHLRTLPAAQSGYIKQLLVDLPAQGGSLIVERAADGNGIIILAGTEQAYSLGHHFPDADLIFANLGADDVAALPTGTLTGTQIISPVQAGL